LGYWLAVKRGGREKGCSDEGTGFGEAHLQGLHHHQA
jgi:hypothetical protein